MTCQKTGCKRCTNELIKRYSHQQDVFTNLTVSLSVSLFSFIRLKNCRQSLFAFWANIFARMKTIQLLLLINFSHYASRAIIYSLVAIFLGFLANIYHFVLQLFFLIILRLHPLSLNGDLHLGVWWLFHLFVDTDVKNLFKFFSSYHVYGGFERNLL